MKEFITTLPGDAKGTDPLAAVGDFLVGHVGGEKEAMSQYDTKTFTSNMEKVVHAVSNPATLQKKAMWALLDEMETALREAGYHTRTMWWVLSAGLTQWGLENDPLFHISCHAQWGLENDPLFHISCHAQWGLENDPLFHISCPEGFEYIKIYTSTGGVYLVDLEYTPHQYPSQPGTFILPNGEDVLAAVSERLLGLLGNFRPEPVIKAV